MSVIEALAGVTKARIRARGLAPKTVSRSMEIVATRDHDALRLDERGDRFYNTYLFVETSEGTAVSHLRYGESNAVLLGVFTQIRPERYRLATPHLCGQDLYDAHVRISTDAVAIRWCITGPSKHQRVLSVYTP